MIVERTWSDQVCDLINWMPLRIENGIVSVSNSNIVIGSGFSIYRRHVGGATLSV